MVGLHRELRHLRLPGLQRHRAAAAHGLPQGPDLPHAARQHHRFRLLPRDGLRHDAGDDLLRADHRLRHAGRHHLRRDPGGGLRHRRHAAAALHAGHHVRPSAGRRHRRAVLGAVRLPAQHRGRRRGLLHHRRRRAARLPDHRQDPALPRLHGALPPRRAGRRGLRDPHPLSDTGRRVSLPDDLGQGQGIGRMGWAELLHHTVGVPGGLLRRRDLLVQVEPGTCRPLPLSATSQRMFSGR